jgi:hypothetical protein
VRPSQPRRGAHRHPPQTCRPDGARQPSCAARRPTFNAPRGARSSPSKRRPPRGTTWTQAYASMISRRDAVRIGRVGRRGGVRWRHKGEAAPASPPRLRMRSILPAVADEPMAPPIGTVRTRAAPQARHLRRICDHRDRSRRFDLSRPDRKRRRRRSQQVGLRATEVPRTGIWLSGMPPAHRLVREYAPFWAVRPSCPTTFWAACSVRPSRPGKAVDVALRYQRGPCGSSRRSARDREHGDGQAFRDRPDIRRSRTRPTALFDVVSGHSGSRQLFAGSTEYCLPDECGSVVPRTRTSGRGQSRNSTSRKSGLCAPRSPDETLRAQMDGAPDSASGAGCASGGHAHAGVRVDAPNVRRGDSVFGGRLRRWSAHPLVTKATTA